MNCKQGDICVVKPTKDGSFCEWAGLLVEVIGPVKEEMEIPDLPGYVVRGYNISANEWFCKIIGGVKTPIPNDEGIKVSSAYGRMWDHRLRPFRGQEGQDETLTWLDVPSIEGVAA